MTCCCRERFKYLKNKGRKTCNCMTLVYRKFLESLSFSFLTHFTSVNISSRFSHSWCIHQTEIIIRFLKNSSLHSRKTSFSLFQCSLVDLHRVTQKRKRETMKVCINPDFSGGRTFVVIHNSLVASWNMQFLTIICCFCKYLELLQQ